MSRVRHARCAAIETPEPRRCGRCSLVPAVSALLVCALCRLAPAVAQGNDIQIQTPTLPPRSGAPVPTTPAAGASPQPVAPPVTPSHTPAVPGAGYGQPSPAGQPYGQGIPPANAPGQYGAQPNGGMPPGGGPGHASASYPTGPAQLAVPSPMTARRAENRGAWGAPPPDAPPAVALAPQAASSAPGGCRPQMSPDRQSITLLGADALPRAHIPLGDFRVQKIFPAPGGAWAVAITKLRGADEYAAMTIDLNRCKSPGAVGVNGLAAEVEFEGETAVLQLPGGRQRISLAAPGGR
jgi:hypothetical protein